ncbi:MAG: hypothetical protein GY822_00810 [Deltaproteobacteria bacterium]|nr:hypothetical protein [Deltaproteobacteria bacterium]
MSKHIKNLGLFKSCQRFALHAFSKRLASKIGLFAAVIPFAILVGCTPVVEPEPEHPCTADIHCVYDDGSSECETGFAWEDASDEENYNCLTLTGVLGANTHSLNNVLLEQISDGSDGLSAPRDLAFNPDDDIQLWAVNYNDNSISELLEPGTDYQTPLHFNSFGSAHFLAHPAALAFGESGLMATAQEEDRETQGPVAAGGSPADFMGPSLWPTNLSDFDGGHASHMDMLHNSPNSTGMAWETGNAYWNFDGAHNAITRYDFRTDHGQGGAYHGDGITARYVSGEVSYLPNVSSHMEFDHDTSLLYIADSGNNRIAVLDTTTGTRGSVMGPNYDGGEQYLVDGASLSTLIDGVNVEGLNQPSGLELHDGMIFVSDYESGMIFAFSKEGEVLDYIDTGLGGGALQGMAFSSTGELFFVNTDGNSIWRLQAK